MSPQLQASLLVFRPYSSALVGGFRTVSMPCEAALARGKASSKPWSYFLLVDKVHGTTSNRFQSRDIFHPCKRAFSRVLSIDNWIWACKKMINRKVKDNRSSKSQKFFLPYLKTSLDLNLAYQKNGWFQLWGSLYLKSRVAKLLVIRTHWRKRRLLRRGGYYCNPRLLEDCWR